MCQNDPNCGYPAPANLPGNLPWRHHRDDPITFYKYGSQFGQVFRIDGMALRCPIGNCTYFHKDVNSFIGRRHFQEWHGYTPQQMGGQNSQQKRAIVSQARLVAAPQLVALSRQWSAVKKAAGGEPPYDRQGVLKPGQQAPNWGVAGGPAPLVVAPAPPTGPVAVSAPPPQAVPVSVFGPAPPTAPPTNNPPDPTGQYDWVTNVDATTTSLDASPPPPSQPARVPDPLSPRYMEQTANMLLAAMAAAEEEPRSPGLLGAARSDEEMTDGVPSEEDEEGWESEEMDDGEEDEDEEMDGEEGGEDMEGSGVGTGDLAEI